tara:strand:+ start:164 stop:304 length:141 start_codon:yes stop_codon:yes gene_type:complete
MSSGLGLYNGVNFLSMLKKFTLSEARSAESKGSALEKKGELRELAF